MGASFSTDSVTVLAYVMFWCYESPHTANGHAESDYAIGRPDSLVLRIDAVPPASRITLRFFFTHENLRDSILPIES